ncbi:hypothetical protein [Mycoplasmopsis pulmonis]|uniref:hypothetical protein n=1 Tax=Mycoplasmopsis pulmonis TaxID=2107 RepID=UPI001004E780|nr:hypothetical protein [Mycoplasmopsis pulmonis]VEU68418.1 Uncharacterised protein [Mycoplasmopsis pulmonis]
MNKFKKILLSLTILPLSLVAFVSCQSDPNQVKSNTFKNIKISSHSMYGESIRKEGGRSEYKEKDFNFFLNENPHITKDQLIEHLKTGNAFFIDSMEKFRKYFPEKLFPGKPNIENFDENFFQKHSLFYFRGYHVYLGAYVKYQWPIVKQLNYNKSTKNIELTIQKERDGIRSSANDAVIDENFDWLLIFDKSDQVPSDQVNGVLIKYID